MIRSNANSNPISIDTHSRLTRHRARRTGSVLMLMIVMLVVVLVCVGLVVDVNWMALGNTELQAATDQTARAALFHYATDTATSDDDQRLANAIAQGQTTFNANTIGGQRKTLPAAGVEFGRTSIAVDGSQVFTEGAQPYNSVRTSIDLSQDASAIDLFIAPLLGGRSSFEPRAHAVVRVDRIDVVLALDVSRSMVFVTGGHDAFPPGGDFYSPPVTGARWFDMVDESEAFLNNLRRNNGMASVGLVTFGGGMDDGTAPLFPNIRSRREFPLGSFENVDALNARLDYYTTGPLGLGTSLSDALADGVRTFNETGDAEADRVMILLSDGEQWFGDATDTLVSPEVAAIGARNAGVTVHCIYYSGPPTGDGDLRTIAGVTGGQFFNAQNAAELETALNEITKLLPIRLIE